MPLSFGCTQINSCESGEGHWKYGTVIPSLVVEWGRRKDDPYIDLTKINWGRNDLRIKLYGLNQLPISFTPKIITHKKQLIIRIGYHIQTFYLEVNGIRYLVQKPHN